MRKLRWIFVFACFLLSAAPVSQAGALTPAALVANDYNVEESAVQNLLTAGWNTEELNRATFLALASDQKLEEVINYKEIAGDWEGTEKLLGITGWHVKKARHALIANQLHQITGNEKNRIIGLLNQRYHPKAIALAAAFAEKSAEKMDTILAMKLDNRSWYQTGEHIGLSPAEVDFAIQKLNDAFRERSAIGIAFGGYGAPHGYQDTSYYSNGYDINILNFAK